MIKNTNAALVSLIIVIFIYRYVNVDATLQEVDDCLDEDLRIAYVTRQPDRTNIHTILPDGTDRLDLTNTESLNHLPMWSPDGSQIAFMSNRDGNWDVYVMNADGSGLLNLTQDGSDDTSPTWSPDGSQIAFTSNRNGQRDVYVIDLTSNSLLNLTNNPSEDFHATWSPNGNYLAFITDQTTEYGIGVMDLKAKTLHVLEEASQVNDLEWSPDSTNIAFGSVVDDNWEIYTINIETREIRNLTNNQANDLQPKWSPDGSKILFWSGRDGNLEIFVMNIDGSDVINLTRNLNSDSGNIWSPTGDHIAFGSNRLQDGEDLWIMDTDGSNARKVADRIVEFSFTWQPCHGEFKNIS